MSDFNPKVHRRGMGKKSMSFNFADVQNPLALEIKDPSEVRKAFRRWPLIPFAGTFEQSNHGLLHFLNSARFLSPTLGACHESIKSYAFGKLSIIPKTDQDFEIEEDESDILNVQIKRNYVEFIRDNVTLGNNISYSQLGCNLYDTLKGNGNYFIELTHTETLGVKETSAHVHPTENCCYWATLKNQPKHVAISPIFTDEYLRKNPPAVLPIFPFYKHDKVNNTYKTIIHVKSGNFEWYGRPDWIAAWMNVYREHQDADYLIKMAANHFTGQVFIEVEDDDIENDETWDSEDAVEAGFDSLVDRMEKNFTSKADDPQTIMVSTRPYGAKNAFVYQFKPVTSHEFFKGTSDLARQKIIENNQWSERLLGNSVAQGFAQDSFMSELKTKELSVLKYYREKVVYGINIIIEEALKFHEITDFDEVGLSFKSNINMNQDSSSELELNTQFDDLKKQLDAFGVGVRAGAITPTEDDESYFRDLLDMPKANSNVAESWKEDGGYRRPITLKGAEDSESESSRLNEDD